MSTPSTSTSTRATDPYDHVALRRAYDDATVSAVIAAGYDEDTRTVDAKIVLEICALIVACVAQLAFARGSIESAGAQWSLVAVYALFVSVAHGVAKLVERDALVLTRARGADADGREPTKSSTHARCANGLTVRVRMERFDETFSVIVRGKGDKGCDASDALRCDANVGDFVDEDGEFYEDEYEAYVWRALEAFERGKGRGKETAVPIEKIVD